MKVFQNLFLVCFFSITIVSFIQSASFILLLLVSAALISLYKFRNKISISNNKSHSSLGIFLIFVSGLLSAIFNNFSDKAILFFPFFSLLLVGLIMPFKKREEFVLQRRQAFFLVVLMVSLSLIIRLTNLSFLEPYTDEYYHLVEAISFNLMNINYSRSFLTITLPIGILFETFEPSLFLARLWPVILSSIAVIPLYMYLREISDDFGSIFGTFLYVVTPWVTGVSRTVREYAVLPLLLFSVLLVGSKVFSKLNVKHSKKHKLLYSIILYLIGIYFIFVDSNSALLTILVPIILITLYLALNTMFHGKFINLNSKFYQLMLFSTLGVLFIFPSISSFRTDWFSVLSPGTLTSIFNYFGFPLFFVLFFIGIFHASSSNHKSHKLLILSLLVTVYYYTFQIDRYFRPRYSFIFILYLLPILSIGFSRIIVSFQDYKSRLFFIILLILSLNTHIFYPIFDPSLGELITDEKHFSVIKDLNAANIEPMNYDVIITNNKRYFDWNFSEIRSTNNVIEWGCTRNDGKFESIESINGSVLIFMSKREDQDFCIENSDFSNFSKIGEGDDFVFYFQDV